jgi:ACDE family multidrug resistance protein
VLARHAADVHARAVAIVPSPRGRAAQFAEGSFTASLARETPCGLVLLHPDSLLPPAALVAGRDVVDPR